MDESLEEREQCIEFAGGAEERTAGRGYPLFFVRAII